MINELINLLLQEKKVPGLDLEWLYWQRVKIGEKSMLRMGGVDKKERLRDKTRQQRTK